jgi:hypothetical protein
MSATIPGDAPAPAQPKRRGRPPGKSTNDLILHPNGQYYKPIHNRDYYFGTDYRQAIARFRRETPALYAGNKPNRNCDARPPLKDLVNSLLRAGT